MNEFLTLVLPYMATAIGAVLTILVSILLKRISKMDELTRLFNEHILNFTRVVSTLMTSQDCVATRAACANMNQNMIKAPLKEDIAEVAQECEELWVAIRNHHHTEKGVVVGRTHE